MGPTGPSNLPGLSHLTEILSGGGIMREILSLYSKPFPMKAMLKTSNYLTTHLIKSLVTTLPYVEWVGGNFATHSFLLFTFCGHVADLLGLHHA